jgi:hypothetical protein
MTFKISFYGLVNKTRDVGCGIRCKKSQPARGDVMPGQVGLFAGKGGVYPSFLGNIPIDENIL